MDTALFPTQEEELLQAIEISCPLLTNFSSNNACYLPASRQITPLCNFCYKLEIGAAKSNVYYFFIISFLCLFISPCSRERRIKYNHVACLYFKLILIATNTQPSDPATWVQESPSH